MTRDEAKALLELYRPGGRDAADPRLAEALQMVSADPELAGWFAREQAFDARICQSLRATPVPAQLQTAILAGGKVLEHLVWWQLVNWRRVAVCAAVLLVGAGFFFFSLNRTQGMIAATQEAIAVAEMRASGLPLQTNNLDSIRAYLAKCHAPSDFQLPKHLSRIPVVGCTLVGVNVQTASVIRFRITGGTSLTLVVTNQMEDEDIPTDGSVKIIQDGVRATAIWNQDGKTYMVFGNVPVDSLRRILI